MTSKYLCGWVVLMVIHQACSSLLSEIWVLLRLQHPPVPRPAGITLGSHSSRAAPGTQGKGVRVYVCLYGSEIEYVCREV